MRYRKNKENDSCEIILSKAEQRLAIRRQLEFWHKRWSPNYEVVFWRSGKACEILVIGEGCDIPKDLPVPVPPSPPKPSSPSLPPRLNSASFPTTQWQEWAASRALQPRHLLPVARRRLGLSARALAARAGISVSHLCRIETGRLPLSRKLARQLAPILEVPWTTLAYASEAARS